jgi:hypothetical protein
MTNHGDWDRSRIAVAALGAVTSADRRGTPVAFTAADMNHVVARQRAAAQGLPPPTDFRGALAAALQRR